jgi:hypothetical protein
VTFVDLKSRYARSRDDVQASTRGVPRRRCCAVGPEVAERREGRAGTVGVGRCIGVPCGTGATRAFGG